MNDLAAKNAKGAKKGEAWPMVRLGDVCEVLDYKRKPITKKDRVSGGVPYYGASGVVDYVNNYIFDERLVLLGEDGAKWGAGDNSAFIIEGKTWVNNHAHVLRMKECVIDEFLVQYLNCKDLSDSITGVTVPKLNQQKMCDIQIPLPPLEVQKEIVERLEKELGEADKVAANFRKIAEMADAEFKAELDETFGELERREFLTQRRKGAESAESACPMVRIGDVCEVQRGVRVTRKDLNEDGKYNVYQNSMKPLGKYDIFNCEGNNPFMIMALAAGEVGYSCDPFWAADDCTYFKNLKNLNSRFLYYLLLFNQRELRRNIRQTTIPRLSNKFLESLQIPLPSVEVQKGIVAKLDAAKERCEKLKAAAERGLRAAENLRKAILAEAFE